MKTTQEIVQEYQDCVREHSIVQPYLIVGTDYTSQLPEIDKALNVPIVINTVEQKVLSVSSGKTDNVFNQLKQPQIDYCGQLKQNRFVPYNQLGRNLSFTIPRIVQFYYYQLLNPFADTHYGNLYLPNTPIDLDELSKQLDIPIFRSRINAVSIPTFVFCDICGGSQDRWLLYEQSPANTWDLNDCAKQCLSVKYP